VPTKRPSLIAQGREAEILSWDSGTVLRLYRDPGAGERADCEMLVLDAVRSLLPLVPAPRARVDWEGRPGIVMEQVAGRDMLSELQRRPWRLFAMAALVGRVQADLHGIRAPDRLQTLRAAIEARLERSAAIPQPLRTLALDQLAGLPDGDRLCHGDFHPGNILLGTNGPVVIDWSFAARGDPTGDFARTTLMMRVGSIAPGTPFLIRTGRWIGGGAFTRAYRRAYEARRSYDRAALHRWELVRAIDRLADEIPEERSDLLREVDRLERRLAIDRHRMGRGGEAR